MMQRTPKYVEITAYLRAVVAESQEGDLLPTVADLCDRFGVSGVQTIRNAYQPLIDEGLVTVQQRPRRRWIVERVGPVPTIDDRDTVLAAAVAALEEDAREHLRKIIALRNQIAA